MSKINVIGCGLGGSVFAQSICTRYSELFELNYQFITADCDQAILKIPHAIPGTSRGSSKSYNKAKEQYGDIIHRFIKKIQFKENTKYIVIAAMGGGSGNAIKDELIDTLLDHNLNNCVLFIPILPMLQEGVSAVNNVFFGLSSIQKFVYGDEKSLSVFPLNLQSALNIIGDPNIHLLQKRLEMIFNIFFLFEDNSIKSTVKSSFTVDASEYESILWGEYSYDKILVNKYFKKKRIPSKGHGLLTYQLSDIGNIDDHMNDFDLVVPGLDPNMALKHSTDICISLLLSTFSIDDKINKFEKHLLSIQKSIHDINHGARIISGLASSPSGKDQVMILASGATLDCILNYYEENAIEMVSHRDRMKAETIHARNKLDEKAKSFIKNL